MPVNAIAAPAIAPVSAPSALSRPLSAGEGDEAKLRETFDKAIGETLFGQMLKSMRKTVGKPAYFHGGRAEEVFQQQLDQVLAEKLSKASAEQFTGPMFELFVMGRR